MNEDKFTGLADTYAKYRPSYPEAFLEYLYSQVGLSENSVIADIGSGTGIFTELLLRQNSFVYGVEPNADMSGVARQALSKYEKFTPVSSSAENTGLKASSIDFITAAQAFHWFDRQKFKIECRRLLKENGKVILVWNSRDSASALVMENDALNYSYCPNFKGFSLGTRGETPEGYSDFFTDGICDYKVFENGLIFDEDSFIGRNLSGSYAPKAGSGSYQPYISALRRLFYKHNSSGLMHMPNLTKSFIGAV
jgi:SAM-dependent methyltransferase